MKKEKALPFLTDRATRVLIAANELYKRNDTFSLTQLYHAMGGEGELDRQTAKEINEDLRLLSSQVVVKIFQSTGTSQMYTEYTSLILPHERVPAKIDEKFVDNAIHVFRPSIFLALAEEATHED